MPPTLNETVIAALQDALRRMPSYKGISRRPAKSETILSLRERLPKILPAVILTAQARGYSVAIHGSLSRDADLVIVPWSASAAATPPTTLMPLIVQAVQQANGGYAELRDKAGAVDNGAFVDLGSPGAKPHGRLVWSVFIDPDRAKSVYLDISIFPPYPIHAPYEDPATVD